MKIIKIKKLSGDFSDNYCVELIENQKVSEIYYVKKPQFVFDIILQNIKDFNEIELRCFLNEYKRSFLIERHSISLLVKSNYKTIYPFFENAVDYKHLKIIIIITLKSLRINDRISIKF